MATVTSKHLSAFICTALYVWGKDRGISCFDTIILEGPIRTSSLNSSILRGEVVVTHPARKVTKIRIK